MLEMYAEDGFYVSEEPIIREDAIEDAIAGASEIMSGVYDTGIAPPQSRWKPGDDQSILRKINMPQVSSSSLRELVKLEEIGDFAHSVTGAEDIQIWWSQLIYKPPEQEDRIQLNEVTCHQDSTYEPDWSPDSHLFTIWIALSDVAEDLGPLQYLRGSHCLGALKKDISYFDRFEEIQETYNPYLDVRFEEITVPMAKGHISCHHRHIYHGSGPNKGLEPRIAVGVHLCADGSKVTNRSMYTENLENLQFCPVIRGISDRTKVWAA